MYILCVKITVDNKEYFVTRSSAGISFQRRRSRNDGWEVAHVVLKEEYNNPWVKDLN